MSGPDISIGQRPSISTPAGPTQRTEEAKGDQPSALDRDLLDLLVLLVVLAELKLLVVRLKAELKAVKAARAEAEQALVARPRRVETEQVKSPGTLVREREVLQLGFRPALRSGSGLVSDQASSQSSAPAAQPAVSPGMGQTQEGRNRAGEIGQKVVYPSEWARPLTERGREARKTSQSDSSSPVESDSGAVCDQAGPSRSAPSASAPIPHPHVESKEPPLARHDSAISIADLDASKPVAEVVAPTQPNSDNSDNISLLDQEIAEDQEAAVASPPPAEGFEGLNPSLSSPQVQELADQLSKESEIYVDALHAAMGEQPRLEQSVPSLGIRVAKALELDQSERATALAAAEQITADRVELSALLGAISTALSDPEAMPQLEDQVLRARDILERTQTSRSAIEKILVKNKTVTELNSLRATVDWYLSLVWNGTAVCSLLPVVGGFAHALGVLVYGPIKSILGAILLGKYKGLNNLTARSASLNEYLKQVEGFLNSMPGMSGNQVHAVVNAEIGVRIDNALAPVFAEQAALRSSLDGVTAGVEETRETVSALAEGQAKLESVVTTELSGIKAGQEKTDAKLDQMFTLMLQGSPTGAAQASAPIEIKPKAPEHSGNFLTSIAGFFTPPSSPEKKSEVVSREEFEELKEELAKRDAQIAAQNAQILDFLKKQSNQTATA